MKKYIALCIIFLSQLLIPSWGYCIQVNPGAIAQIESSNNPRAYNQRSKARGLCQITPVCLKEYNNYHTVKYTLDDLFNAHINIQIADWYLNKRIPTLLAYYHIPDTIENRLIAYNYGIGHLLRGDPLPQKTINYIKKYSKIIRKEGK